MTVTLLIPTINEMTGLQAVMPRIKPEWCEQILVVDGGSTDGTVEYARALGCQVVLQDRQQPGLASGCRQAYPFVKGDILITFSPDGNSIPELIPALIAKMKEGYDMVIVSRYLDDAVSHDDDLKSRTGNWVITTLINVCFQAGYTDSLVIFRAYRRPVVGELGLLAGGTPVERLCSRLNSWELLSSIRAAKRRLKVGAIPGSEPSRLGGVSKIPKFRAGLYCLAAIIQEVLLWRYPPARRDQ